MPPVRPVSTLPALPIVTAVAAAMLATGCDAPGARREEPITRVCQDSDGRRTTDENCQNGARGYSFAYVHGIGGAIGDRIDAPRSNPGDVRRGGFGMSAYSSAGE